MDLSIDLQKLKDRITRMEQQEYEHQRVAAAFLHRIEIEKLLSEISAQLISSKSQELDWAIQDALGKVGRFISVDRGSVFLLSGNGSQIENTHRWSIEGIEPPIERPQGIPASRFPWLMTQLHRHHVVHLPSVEDLPADANQERELFASRGIRSHIAIPMVFGGSLAGYLGFDGIRSGNRWVDDDAGFFKLLGDIMINALERQRVEASLHYLAHFDSLTALPNRSLLLDRLNQELSRSRWRKRLVAVICLDIDRFQRINDTLGHQTGDQLIQAVARRLTECLRDGDTVARPGGDEFALILTDINQVYDVSKIAQKILDSLSQVFSLDGHEFFVTASLGISIHPSDGEKAEELLQRADTAMCRAKEQGKNHYQLYSPSMNARAFERLVLETNLQHALERQEFLLYYQPQVDLSTGQIVGLEALLRWRHPDLGLIMPSEFIPLLEETGLILPVGDWILHTACTQAKAWHQAGFSDLRIAVNLSPRQFQKRGLVETISHILEETSFPPQWLELELTEGILMQYTTEIMSTLEGWHSQGIQLTLDDFGTGYSSLSYLKRFPIDVLKIDRSFIRDITTNPDDAAITSTIIAMAHNLNIKVVAEGVETQDQLEFLIEHHCHLMQGYYFSHPRPADDILQLLQAGSRLDIRQGTKKGTGYLISPQGEIR